MGHRFLAARVSLALAGFLLLIFGLVSIAPAPAAAAVPPGNQMLEGVNASRAEAGLPPLIKAEVLDALAAERSADMAARGYFSHTTPEGVDVFALMRERGIGYAAAAENLAWNTHGEDGAVAVAVALQGFLNSPPHRANLLNPEFRQLGVGVASDGDETYFTLLFVG